VFLNQANPDASKEKTSSLSLKKTHYSRNIQIRSVTMPPLQHFNIKSESAAMKASLASPKASKKRPISFSNTAVLCRTDGYSDEEMTAAWYSRAELKNILFQIKKTLLLMEAGSPKANSDRHCTRGLASLTPEGRALKQRRREEAKTAVLDEQEFQNEVGFPDLELLADLYFEETRVSLAMAISMGRADEEEVVRSTDMRPPPRQSPRNQKPDHCISRSGSVRRMERQDSIRLEFSRRGA
jgi:hypothetical protein